MQVQDYMNISPSETPEPVLLTDGTYDFKVISQREDKVGEDQKTKVTLNLKPIAVVEGDFPDDQLKYAKIVRQEFWMTEPALLNENPAVSARVFNTRILGLDPSTSYRMGFEQALGQVVRGVTRQEMEGREKNIRAVRVKRYLQQ